MMEARFCLAYLDAFDEEYGILYEEKSASEK